MKARSSIFPTILALSTLGFWEATGAFSAEEAANETEVTLTLTAPAKFEREAHNTWLRLKDTTQIFRFHWSYQSNEGKTVASFPCELQEGQACTFTIEGVRHAGSDALINAQLMLITSAEGKTLYDRTICAVHGCKMEKKDVPIIYGLPAINPEDPSPQQTKELFPNRFEVSFGGCIPMPDKKMERVLVCPECRVAFAKWKAGR